MRKRTSSVSILCLLLLTFIASPCLGQSTKRILKKMLDAQGGKEAFESIKDMTLTGSVEMAQQGIGGTMTMYKKEPDKRRVELVTMDRIIVQAYDGQIAWWTNPQTGNPEEMNEQDTAAMKRQALPLVASIEPEEYGITFIHKGKENIGGRDYHILEQTYEDGYVMLRYVDAETYLTGRTRSARVGPGGVEIHVEQVMSDFKKVGRMTMAHSIVTYYNGEIFTTITLKEVKFNTGLDDSLFKKEN